MANLEDKTRKKRLNGEGNIRERSYGRWEGRYTDPITGKIKSIYHKKKQDVVKELNKITSSIFNGMYVSIDTTITLDEYFELWLKRYKQKCRKQSLNNYIRNYRVPIQPIIGRMIASKISYRDIQNVVDYWKTEDLSESMIEGLTVELKGIFKKLLLDQLIKDNPVNHMIIFPVGNEKNEKQMLSAIEVKMFFKGIEERFGFLKMIFQFLMFTGIRAGELCSLKWNYFAPDLSTVQIKSTMVFYENERYDQDKPKTKASNRTTSLPSNFMKSMEKYKEDMKFKLEMRKETFAETGYVFQRVNRTGELVPYDQGCLNTYINAVIQYVEKQYCFKIPPFTCYYFRHMYASKLCRTQAPPKDV